MQEDLMLYDPQDCTPKPYPSHAKQYREYHGGGAWLFNPWSGTKRHPLDIGSDVFGVGIRVNENTPLKAAEIKT